METNSNAPKNTIVSEQERNPIPQNSPPQPPAEILMSSPHPSLNNPPGDVEQSRPIGQASNVPIPVPVPVPAPARAQFQERNFPCPLCIKVFAAQRALFGHLRAHPEREWRGAYPPPVFSRAEFAHTGLLNPEEEEDDYDDVQEEEENVQDVDLGGEVVAHVPEEATTDQAEGATATTKAPLQIDLNIAAQPELPDLNLPSSPCDDAHN